MNEGLKGTQLVWSVQIVVRVGLCSSKSIFHQNITCKKLVPRVGQKAPVQGAMPYKGHINLKTKKKPMCGVMPRLYTKGLAD